jgi:hypothetical protein
MNPTRFPFAASTELASNLVSLQASLQASTESYINLISSACATNEQLVLSDALQYAPSSVRFLFSKNNMVQTTSLWKLDGITHTLLGTSTKLLSATFTALGISFVTDKDVFFWNATTGLTAASGVPVSFTSVLNTASAAVTGSTTIGHVGSAYCDATTLIKSSIAGASENNRAVVLWRRQAGFPLLYSNDGGYSFVSIDIGSKLSSLLTFTAIWVTDVAVLPTHQGLTLNVRYTQNGVTKDQIVIAYNVFNDQSGVRFVLGRLSVTTPTTLMHVHALPSGSGEVFAVSGTSVRYSPDGGINFFAVSLASRNPALPALGLGATESIVQFVASRGGYFAVLTSTRR